MTTRLHRWAVVAVALLLGAAAPAWGQLYIIESLGFLTGTFARGRGVDANGIVVGEATIAGPGLIERAVRFDPAGSTELGGLGGTRSRALDVSPNGRIGGWALDANGRQQPVQWSPGSTQASPLPTLAGGTGSVWGVAPGNGPLVGQSAVSPTQGRAVRWDGGVISDLGTLGGSFSLAYHANADGVVVGSADTAAGVTRAARWFGASIEDLGSLGGGSWSAARRVNASGAMILWGQPADAPDVRATIWSGQAGEDPLSLGTFGGSESWAYGLNDLGQVVGTADNANGTYQGFVWAGLDLTPLGTLGGPFSAALSINEAGIIAGWAMDAANRTHAVRWLPIPEPAAAALLLAALALAAAARTRRRGR